MKKIAILFLVIFVLCCTGCNKQGVTNIHNMVYGDQTLSTVERCIATGAVKAGWQIEQLHSGQFEATYLIQDRRDFDIKGAIVNIDYSTKSYFIGYNQSAMLLFNETRNTIHKNYNKWVRQLDAAIQRELASAELDAREIKGTYQLMEYDASVFGYGVDE